MPPSLRSSFEIARLAADLQLGHPRDPVAAILAFCHKRVNDVRREFGCATLSELLRATAATLDTLFVEIHDDVKLADVRTEYLTRGERVFATLAEQLGPHVYAITFRLTRPRVGDRQFISIIDCRGTKGGRSYFSKWHELAHLLTLTSQARLKFCRTHSEPEERKDPEEALMDVIAGEVGFSPEIVRPHATGEISFDRITSLREQLCPDASQQASLMGFVKSWPAPCVLVEARPGLRAREARSLAQRSFPFHDRPTAVLRAVNVTVNGAAEHAGMIIHRNMRIPRESVISKVLENGLTSLEAKEDLAWWTSSSGRGLAPRPVTVKARRRREAAVALVVPA